MDVPAVAVSAAPGASPTATTDLDPPDEPTALATLKEERAQAVISEQEAYTSLHRVDIEPLVRPTVPDADAIHLASVTPIAGDGPADATAALEPDAESLLTDDLERRLDGWWDALCGNDPETLLEHLTRTFATSPLPVVPVRVRGRVLDLAVLTPSRHLLPRSTVGLQGGTLSIRTATAGHSAWLHRQVVAGLSLWAARQALADAPGVSSVRVHALSVEHRGHYDDVSVLGVTQLDRDVVERVDLGLDAETLLILHSRELQWQTGGLNASLQPLQLAELPALAPLLARLCRTTTAALA
ncbi:hypothetical protein KC207_13890 [Phycicoccus sp. BSK3Z-2]|uniref:Uncharacterized protein n=1 Tax=Phycicoccus avicenniae TaxID=2828860 RepID=A0A941I1K0_9MICO|nr:hypothetical protein [Phycicoccus avicenniae]